MQMVWRKSNIPSINVWILRRRVKQSFPESVDYRTTFRLKKTFSAFSCRFAGVFGILVLLHDPVSAKFKLKANLSFDSRILWYTEFMANLITVRCSGPVPAEQAQIITLPLPCLTVGVCLCWCVQSFTLFAVFSYQTYSHELILWL